MTKRLRSEETILLIVDVQERLVPAIFESQSVVHSCTTLAQAAQALQIPVIVTEQYPEKLGATVPEIRGVLHQFQPLSKKQFSSCTPEVMDVLKSTFERRSILLCGVEAHVCVQQTALDLLANDFDVFVARDAISSRTIANAEIGWQRMIGAGAIPVSVESALFELLQTADHPQFKAVHQLIK
jgi:nicotinamidase-related amidase